MTKKTMQAAKTPLAAFLLLGAGSYAMAQTAPAADSTKTADATSEEVVVLSPFVVSSADSQDGYQVKDTLGGTRVRTDLADVASSISVVSKKFLEDTGATNAQQLLIYTTNTEVAGLNGNFSGSASRAFGVQGNAELGRLGNPNAVNRSRGLSAMDGTRNYFLSEIPWDSFNIDRVDISRGPNSFLFGVGSPSGISNYSTYEAVFQNKGSVEFKYSSFNSTRESLDYNKVLLPDELAVRLDLLNDDTKFQQKPAFNHTQRLYAALRYDPKFLKTDTAETSIKINGEFGRVRSNNPRSLPPLDYITGYFDGVVTKTGYNPWEFNTGAQTDGVGSYSSGVPGGDASRTLSPWVNGSSIHYIWPGPGAAYWYDARTGTMLDAMTTLNGTNDNAAFPKLQDGLAPMSQVSALYTSGFYNYAMTMNQRNSSLFPGAYAGTAVYADKSLTDDSIFDFYNKLIDGDTKKEWQNWRSFNISADQTFFKKRLAIQATYDHQEFDYGSEGLLTSYMQPYISVDVDAYKIVYPPVYSQAVANPNVGRPFIASDYSPSNSSTKYVHDNVQIIANGELRGSDFTDPRSNLAKMIGTHSFTGLYGEYRTKTETRNWSLYAVDVPFAESIGGSAVINSRVINWVSYLGESMVNVSSPSGLDLSAVTTMPTPTSGTLQHFYPVWNAAASVDPTASWTNPADPTGSYLNRDNPANYVGWRTISVNVLDSKNDIEDLYQSGTKRLERLKSMSFMYQAKMFDEAVIPMFGYRKDKVRQRATNAPLNPSTHIASMDYDITGEDAIDTTISRSYGLTLRLPASMRKDMPWGTDISLHYFHGANSTPKIRYGFDSRQLPGEYGKTDDYGFQINTLNDRVSLRVTYFKTLDFNAAAGSGVADPLGANGYYLYLLPAWGAGDAAVTGKYILDNSDSAWGFANAGQSTPTAVQVAAVADWRARVENFFTQSFFDSYGLGVNVNALKTGNYQAVYGLSGTFFPWSIANTGAGKVNGSYPIISQDLESKGWEIEATVRPVKNWDITFNVSKVQAVQTAIGESTEAFILAQKEFWDGDAGDLHLWGYWNGAQNENSTLRRTFYTKVWSAFLAQKAQLGCSQPELRNWNAKIISNYSFQTGFLKGFNLGGAYRWGSKPIIGYGVHQVDDGYGNQIYISDKDAPLYGRVDEHFDLWVGYGRKLTEKIDWRIQLNVQNVLESARLTPITKNPDGAVAQYRITQGQTFSLTNTFKF